MSKIKLPHASGNSMSIAAPATNPASDLELKLPATVGTAGQVLKNSSTPGTLEFGSAGKILQVVNFTSTDTELVSYSSGGHAAWHDTLVTMAITPSSSSSKILVSGQLAGEGNAADKLWRYRINRSISGGSATALQGVSVGSYRLAAMGTVYETEDESTTATQMAVSNYMDSPSTTSAVTYTFQVHYGASATWYTNFTVGDADDWPSERLVSWLTLMEVAG